MTIHSSTSIPPSVLAGPGPALGPGTATRTGDFTLVDNNEVIYAYVGTAVSAFDEIEADVDVAVYIGSTDCTSLALTQCASLFNTVSASSWEADKGGGDQSQDGTGADFPAPGGGSAMGLISASIDIPISYGILPIKLIFSPSKATSAKPLSISAG